MHVFVDGNIYEFQKTGGIPRIFTQVLPRMCDLDQALDVTLLVAGGECSGLPWHDRIRIVPRVLLSNALGFAPAFIKKGLDLMQRLAFLSLFNIRQPGVWYASYYKLPWRWQGPVVVLVADIIHELYPDLFSGRVNAAFRRRKRQVILRADKIICISETTRKDVIRYYGVREDKTAVVPLACGEAFRVMIPREMRGALPTGKPFLLYVGARIHYKNFDRLVKAYAAWPRASEVDLVLVGAPLTEEEKGLLQSLGVLGSVHILSTKVDDEALCQLYNQALAFVYPSLYEGFGIPLLEAMACGCPVIASDIPSSREVAGDAPFYFSPQDKEALLRCLDEVKGGGFTEERKREGIVRAKNYSWSRTAQGTLDIMRAALNEWEGREAHQGAGREVR